MPAPVLQIRRGNAVGSSGTVPALRPGEPAISLNNFDFFIGIDTSVVNNKFFGSHRYWGREDGTTSLRLKLVDKDGTNSIKIKAPDTVSIGSTDTYTLPNTNTITAGYFLKVAADGTLSWDSVGSVSSNFSSPTLSGVTTITGSLNNQANTINSGITTFTNTTDNVLGNTNTGSVQIDGGVGIDKNVSIGGSLYVSGQSYFVGLVTFAGGTITLGDDGGDNINVGGEFTSGLFPNTTNTYDFGDASRQWRNASFAGIGTFSTGAAIGTSILPSGSVLAVGSGITMSDTSISASNFYGTFNGTITGTASTATRANTLDVSDTDAQTGNILFASSGNGVTVYNDTDLTYNSNTNTLTATNIQSSAIKALDGTSAITISNSTGDVSISGNLFINGNTTQVNTSELQVYDRTITLGIQSGTTATTTTWDLGILMNYGDAGVAKTAGMIWDYATRRFRFGYDTDNPASTGTTTPQIGITSYAAIEVAELWINNTCVTDRVIGCTGGTLVLENITIDAGQF